MQMMKQVLVDHPKIHLRARNKDGKTALDLCQSQPRPEYQECARRIEEALRRPKKVVKIKLMDGQTKEVVLHAGYETTVDEINLQMTQMLHLDSKEDNGGGGDHDATGNVARDGGVDGLQPQVGLFGCL